MRNLVRDFNKDESGAIILWTAMMMAVLMVIGSLAVNFGHRHLIVNRLQVTADMAALAGASQLPNENNVKVQANAYAEANMPAAKFQDVLATPDIVLGNFREYAAICIGDTSAAIAPGRKPPLS